MVVSIVDLSGGGFGGAGGEFGYGDLPVDAKAGFFGDFGELGAQSCM